MNKKKIISSLTIAGMLATTATGAGVFAADDEATNKIGEYKNVIENTTIVPFKLQSDSDKVTENDLKISYPGAIVKLTAEQTKRGYLVTGDVVKINGADRTIVIYGDVNSDGVVDIFDANDMLANVKGKANAPKLTAAQMEAARLSDRGEMSVFDVNAVLAVAKGKTPAASMEVSKPATETQPEEVVAKVTNMEVISDNEVKLKFDKDASGYKYTITDNVENKDLVIGKKTFEAGSNNKIVTLQTTTNFSKNDNQTYTVKVLDESDRVVLTNTFKRQSLEKPTGAVITDKKALANRINADDMKNLSFHVSLEKANKVDTKVIVTLKDTDGREVVGTAQIPANGGAVDVNNFNAEEIKALLDTTLATPTTYNEPTALTLTAKVMDEYGNVSANYTSKIVKDSTPLEVASIDVARGTGDAEVTIQLRNVNKTNIGASNEKRYSIYYMSEEDYNKTKPTTDEFVGTLVQNATDYTKQKVDLSTITSTDKIYVVAVDNNTQLRTEIIEINIPAYGTQLDEVANIARTGKAGEFKWEDTKNSGKVNGYKVIIYKEDGTPIGTKTVSGTSVNILSNIKEYLKEYNLDTSVATTYKIGVIALASSSSYANSAETSSGEATYTTSPLVAPTVTPATAIDIDTTTRDIQLSWTKANNADGYKVLFYKYNEDLATNNYTLSTSAETKIDGLTSKDTDKYNITEAFKILDKARYSVRIQSIANDDSEFLNSAETPNPGDIVVYNVTAPELTYELDGTDVIVKFADVEDFAKVVAHDIYGGLQYVLNYKTTDEDDYADIVYDSVNTKTVKASGSVSEAVNYALVTDKLSGKNTKTLSTLVNNTKYTMFVSVYVDGIEIARTNEISLTTPKQIINWAGYKVYKSTETLIDESLKATEDNELVVRNNLGETNHYTSSNLENFSTIYDIVKALADSRKDMTGSDRDLVTVDKDGKITVTKDSENNGVLDFGNKLSNAKLIMKTNAIVKADNVKSVEIEKSLPADTIFDLTGISNVTEEVSFETGTDVNRIVKVADGVKVKTVANKDITVNDIKVTSAKETTVKKTSSSYEIEAAKNNALNVDYSKDVNVSITFNEDQTQTGTVTFKNAVAGKDYKVTLASNKEVPVSVETKSVVDISSAKVSTITLKAGDATSKVDTNKSVSLTLNTINDVRVIPTSGTVTISGDGTVKGKATMEIKYTPTAGVTLDETTGTEFVTIAKGTTNSKAIKDSESNTVYTITNVDGNTQYKVKKNSDDTYTLTIALDSEAKIQ